MRATVLVRLFSDVEGETLELFGYISGMNRAEFSARFPGIKGRRYDDKRMQVAADPTGRIWPVTRAIEYKKTPKLHRCDARCLYARGKDCECACGGVNHGRGDAGAQTDLLLDAAEESIKAAGFYEDSNARIEAAAAEFALDFMGAALELGGEQMNFDGITGADLPRITVDSRQKTLF